jgi:hypothetical protein
LAEVLHCLCFLERLEKDKAGAYALTLPDAKARTNAIVLVFVIALAAVPLSILFTLT